MSSRLSGKVRFFIDKKKCKKGIISTFTETERNDRGVYYQISSSGDPICFYLSNFNFIQDTPDKLFIGRAAVAEAIASDLYVDYIPCDLFYSGPLK